MNSCLNRAYFQKIKKSFPRLEIHSIRNASGGLANEVFVINENFVFCFPKNDLSASEYLAHEVRVVEPMPKRAEMPLPEFEAVVPFH